jgi:hypothetical protein
MNPAFRGQYAASSIVRSARRTPAGTAQRAIPTDMMVVEDAPECVVRQK